MESRNRGNEITGDVISKVGSLVELLGDLGEGGEGFFAVFFNHSKKEFDFFVVRGWRLIVIIEKVAESNLRDNILGRDGT